MTPYKTVKTKTSTVQNQREVDMMFRQESLKKISQRKDFPTKQKKLAHKHKNGNKIK